MNDLSELGKKIFLDRYAFKDVKKETLAVGDLVIISTDKVTGQRELGTVVKLNKEKDYIAVELKDKTVVETSIESIDKPLETDPTDMHKRVAKAIASEEKTEELRKKYTKEFEWLLTDWKFVPGGRILSGAGTNHKLTYFNCYVIP